MPVRIWGPRSLKRAQEALLKRREVSGTNLYLGFKPLFAILTLAGFFLASGCGPKKPTEKVKQNKVPSLPEQLPLERQETIDPKEGQAFSSALELAALYKGKGMLSQAKSTLVAVLPNLNNPGNRTRGLFELSQIYVTEGKLKEAAALFEKNPTKDPMASAFRRLYLANIYKMSKKEKEAEKIYLGLLDDPVAKKDLSIISNVTSELSQLYQQQGNSQKAITVFNKVLTHLPSGAGSSTATRGASAQARLQMATFHLQAGNTKAALPVLEDLLAVTKNVGGLDREYQNAMDLYVIALLRAKDYEKCATVIRQRLAVKPSSTLFAQLVESADRLLDQGKAAVAEGHYQYLAAKGPETFKEKVLFSLASSQLAQGKEELGTKTLNNIMETNKNRPVRSEAVLLLAQHYENTKQIEKAARHYRMLIADNRYKSFAKDRLAELNKAQ